MPSIPLRTFVIAACLVLGLALVPQLGSLFQLTQATEEPSMDPVAQQTLPEADMVEPSQGQEEEAPEPAPAPETATPEPVEHQSEPVPSVDREVVDSSEPAAVSREASELFASDEKDSVLENLARKEVKKPEQEPVPFREQLPESDRNDFSKLVAAGDSLKKDGIKSPSYKAKMAPDVIDRLRKNGFIRLAVTDGKSIYLFNGSLRQPGDHVFAVRRDFKDWSARGMELDPAAGRELLRIARGRIPGAGTRCQAVMILRTDIDSMVLGAQGRAAASKGTTLEKIKSTSGSFRLYKGMPFNYLIDEITNSKGKRIPIGGGKDSRKKGERS